MEKKIPKVLWGSKNENLKEIDFYNAKSNVSKESPSLR